MRQNPQDTSEPRRFESDRASRVQAFLLTGLVARALNQTISSLKPMKSPLARTGRPVLVTGAHRSGTTWVGRMLSLSRALHYVHEPFNVSRPPGRAIFAGRIPHWYQYISSENEAEFRDAFARMVSLRFDRWSALRGARSREGLRRAARKFAWFTRVRWARRRLLLKDPIALFSAPWLARSFDMQVVVMIRHPAAFASSLKRLDWRFPFHELLCQPLLMRDHLEPFRREIEDFAAFDHDIVDQAAVVWKLTHWMIDRYRASHPDWIFLRHEDLSRGPAAQFRELCHRLDVEFTAAIERAVLDSSDPENPRDAPEGVAIHLKRNSQETVWAWKDKLTFDEVERLRSICGSVAERFYTKDDW